MVDRFVTRHEPAAAASFRRVFWAAVWLAVTLIAIKTYHLGIPRAVPLIATADYARDLAAITYSDVLFAAAFGAAACILLALTSRWLAAARCVSAIVVMLAASCCLYAIVNVFLFDIFGGFLTFPLLSLIGDLRMVRSSVSAQLTPGTVTGLLGFPLLYVLAVRATLTQGFRGSRVAGASVIVLFGLWTAIGQQTFAAHWGGRVDKRIAENSPWVFMASWWQAPSLRMPGDFPSSDLADFEPPPRPAAPVPTMVQRASSTFNAGVRAPRRPPNVILVVLESVGARWTSLNSSLYDTTPTLKAEASHSLVAESSYAHIGRSSNSLVALLLSTYPRLDFREITKQFPNLPGTSLAEVFQQRGYRTAFMTPSDLSWAGWGTFLDGRGFATISDHHNLACSDRVSSWGVEDRCLVDAMVDFVNQERVQPFFLMAWTTQTHHPYEVSPGTPELNLLREPTPDDWELGRYLNILHETDRHLARVFDAVRRAGLEQDTLIVVTGDHGQAFGYPHQNTYIQGRTVYEEDVNVPLMFWFPRSYQKPARTKTVTSHVDLAPTIAEIADLPAAPDWQGRSLFDGRLSHRAYFYVAEDTFTLGVREENWKYIYNLRDGLEELYDLDRDPSEQRNVAAQEPGRCTRLRQRLKAWTEANRRQYERIIAANMPVPAEDVVAHFAPFAGLAP